MSGHELGSKPVVQFVLRRDGKAAGGRHGCRHMTTAEPMVGRPRKDKRVGEQQHYLHYL